VRFTEDVVAQVRWLTRHGRREHIERLRSTLALLRRRLSAHPGIGELAATTRSARVLRVVPIGGRLPYLVWYHYDPADESGAVWLVALQHEKQDRERFDPTQFP